MFDSSLSVGEETDAVVRTESNNPMLFEIKNPVIVQELGMSYQQSGRCAEAAEAYEEAIALAPDKFWIYEPLVQSHMYSRELTKLDWQSLLEDMESAARKYLKVAGSQEDFIAEAFRLNGTVGSEMMFALAWTADQCNEAVKAWKYFTAGNDMEKAKHRKFNLEHGLQAVQYFKSYYNSSFFPTSKENVGMKDSKYPIFIVGLPYSGVEVLEALLDGHSSIFGMNAHPDYFSSLQGQMEEGHRYSVIAKHAMSTAHTALEGVKERGWWKGARKNVLKFAEIIQSNMKKIEAHVSQQLTMPSAKHYLDTDLSNYFALGFYHVLFPNALVINIVRDPLDTLLDIYQHRESNPTGISEQSFDFDTMTIEFISYIDLMFHWRGVMPKQIIDINYDDLVSDPKTALTPVLDYLQLKWQDGMLDFPSSKYLRPAGTWRKYSRQLSPLIASIGKAIRLMKEQHMLPFEHTMNWAMSERFPYDRKKKAASPMPKSKLNSESKSTATKSQKQSGDGGSKKPSSTATVEKK